MANAALFILIFLVLMADAIGTVYSAAIGNWKAIALPYALRGMALRCVATFVRSAAIGVNLLVLRGSYRSQGTIFGMPDALAFGLSLVSPGFLLLGIIAVRMLA